MAATTTNTTNTDTNPNNSRRPQQKVQTIPQAESIISSQVSANRRNEIHEYLKLFGYKADKTIIQVHITGFFRKKGQQQSNQKEKERQAAAVKRYGGTSFVIVGRTHDPSIIENVVKPKKKNPLDASPGYVGYLWKNKDPQKSGTVIDVKKEWTFINDIRQFGINNTQQQITKTTPKTNNIRGSITMDYDINNEGRRKVIDNNNEDPVRIIKRRLAKGEISKEEYEELRKAIEL